jgi:hypothetical protein
MTSDEGQELYDGCQAHALLSHLTEFMQRIPDWIGQLGGFIL